MYWDLEEMAREALEDAARKRSDVGVPVSPARVAWARGLEIYDGGPGCLGMLVGKRIYVDDSMRRERRAFSIAHEIGHHIESERGLPRREWRADYLASALLLPRAEFQADLRRYGWDLIALAARHRWASFETIARRIVSLRDARACVFDRPLAGQRAPSQYTIPWRAPPPTPEEHEAADEALSCGAPVEIRAGLTAWPVVEHGWARAITVATL